MLSDLEMTRLCAEAMGLETDIRKTFRDYQECLTRAKPGEVWSYYDPLNNDAEAMALYKRMRPNINAGIDYWFVYSVQGFCTEGQDFEATNADLNRAIVECCANMQKARSGVSE